MAKKSKKSKKPTRPGMGAADGVVGGALTDVVGIDRASCRALDRCPASLSDPCSDAGTHRCR